MSKRARAGSQSSSSDTDMPSPTPSSTQEATSPPDSTGLKRPSKYAHTSRAQSSQTSVSVMQCHLPPHDPLSFSSYEDYNVHYSQNHVNRCSECNKNFPSDHYLNVHIADNHDPMNEIRRERGEKTYGCFVEGCDKICADPSKRRRHLLDKHGFPKFYDFFIVNDGIDRRTTMLRNNAPRRRRYTHTSSASVEDDGTMAQASASTVADANSTTKAVYRATETENDVGALESSMSALSFVPRSVKFGRGMRAGFAKR